MTTADLMRMGAIYFSQIKEGLNQYQNEMLVMSQKDAWQYFQNEIVQYGASNSFADFYYFRLEEDAKKRVDLVLSEKEREFLCEMQPKENFEENIIFPLNDQLLKIIVKLNDMEMLFSTIYFVGSGEQSSVTYWGNYNYEYIRFSNMTFEFIEK